MTSAETTERKTERLVAYLEPSLWRDVMRAAREDGRSAGNFVRQALRAALKRRKQ